MAESVVVTITAMNYENDFELPWYLSLDKLYPRMLTVLKTLKPTVFNKYKSIVFELEGKGLLDMRKCLADYGVCTGCCLSVVEEANYYG